jgi:hypothetical protein
MIVHGSQGRLRSPRISVMNLSNFISELAPPVTTMRYKNSRRCPRFRLPRANIMCRFIARITIEILLAKMQESERGVQTHVFFQ